MHHARHRTYRPDNTLLLLAGIVAALLALVLIGAAAAHPAPAPTTSSSSAAAVVGASHRGGPAVIRHKARSCYTIRDDAGRVLYRKCSVRWVQDVRHRSTLEQFRARYGGAA